MIRNFVRIGGKRIFPLPLISIVQTDGSFSRRGGAACAFLVRNQGGDQVLAKRLTLSDARTSTETEWASVYHGLSAAVELDQECIGLENDCLSVVAGLLGKAKMKQEYAQYYHYKIMKTAGYTGWTGIRWIPRELNRADALFDGYR